MAQILSPLLTAMTAEEIEKIEAMKCKLDEIESSLHRYFELVGGANRLLLMWRKFAVDSGIDNRCDGLIYETDILTGKRNRK